MNNSEFTVEWGCLSDDDKGMIVDSLAKAFKIPTAKAGTLKRIFDLAKPGVVLGKSDTGAYCRISEDSREVVSVLMKEYL